MNELAVTIDAGDQGAEGRARRGVAADHHLMPRPALGLGPGFAAPRAIGRVQALGDDAFQIHPAGRQQDRVARGDEMIDIPQVRRLAAEMNRQAVLAAGQRQVAKILETVKQHVEHEEHQALGVARGNRRLQRGEIGSAGLIQRHDLAIDYAIAQRRAGGGDLRKLRRPIQAFAGSKARLAANGAQLHAIAVELDLVSPARTGRRLLHRLGQLGLDEVGQHLDRLGLGRRLGFRRLDEAGRRAVVPVALPDRASLRALARHERRGRLALAMGDLDERAPRGDRAIGVGWTIGIAGLGRLVAVLDQHPGGAPTAVALGAHQHPRTVHAAAFHDELQFALGQGRADLLKTLFGRPIAAFPQHHRAAAILALGDRALEVAVVEGMVLDLHGQATIGRVQRGPLGHGPRLEGPFVFET